MDEAELLEAVAKALEEVLGDEIEIPRGDFWKLSAKELIEALEANGAFFV